MPHPAVHCQLPWREVLDYVRKYVPELAHLKGIEIHEPWNVLDGYLKDYPQPIVDHATERLESLARLDEIKASKPLPPTK